jgi:UDP-N-acetylmuramoylalanine--D-glutamate ligase
MKDLHGLPVLVLGLGASGLAMASWCARHGALVSVADTRPQPPNLEKLRSTLPDASFVHSDFSAAMLEGGGYRALFLSPGLTPHQTAPLVQAARRHGLAIGGELMLFAQALEALGASENYHPKVLAVTGTNGKTTVTALTGHLVAWAGKSVAVAGNIGPTLLDTLAQALDAQKLPEVWVLELSSFQLDGISGFEPTAATVLNVTQDHLDWHPDMECYAAAKARIFGKHGLMLLNRDDPRVLAMAAKSGSARSSRAPVRSCLTFGTDMPKQPGDFGLQEEHGMVWLVRALEAEQTLRKRADGDSELHIQRLMPADALRIRGRHNAANALAALALCAAAGCPLGPILFGLREYRGEPHRVQPIGIIHGVEYFDDSKGTNVGATVAALNGLGAERRVVLILGGQGKGQDFSPLAEPVARHARAAVLIGRDASLIARALASTGVPMLSGASMADAVQQAHAQAHDGDAVLLSPACASFDMFDNYEHRAKAYCEAVGSLAADAGLQWEGASQ